MTLVEQALAEGWTWEVMNHRWVLVPPVPSPRVRVINNPTTSTIQPGHVVSIPHGGHGGDHAE